jgi:MFS family permease
MPSARDFVLGPWRAVSVLGVTEILSWGVLFYPPVLTVPLIAADHGWSQSFTMGGFSVGLFVGGLVSRYVGALIDRCGGHVVMPFGSLIGAAGLLGLGCAPNALAYYAAWTVVGVAMAAALYDPAFATLGRIFGKGARAPITALTLAGGFASTVSWPATRILIDTVGWRGAYLVYAALLVVVAAPLHAFALPRQRAVPIAGEADSKPQGLKQGSKQDLPETKKPGALLPAHGVAFVLVAGAFSAYAFVPSALSAQLLAIFERLGLTAATAVIIGMLFGPAQVLARIGELVFAGDLHPLWTARLAVGLLVGAFVLLALLPFSAPLAAGFAVLYGMANGLMTIARGTVPLALFGATGYGRLLGRIAGPYLVVQAAAPVCMSFVSEHTSAAAALTLVAAFAAAALLCFAAIRQPA